MSFNSNLCFSEAGVRKRIEAQVRRLAVLERRARIASTGTWNKTRPEEAHHNALLAAAYAGAIGSLQNFIDTRL